MACWDKTFDLINLSYVSFSCKHEMQLVWRGTFLTILFQAGEKHYHPQCSRCAKCMKIFGEGEEMYLQGSEIWHPQCSEEYRREVSFHVVLFFASFSPRKFDFQTRLLQKKISRGETLYAKKKKRNVNFLICLVSLVTFLFCVN